MKKALFITLVLVLTLTVTLGTVVVLADSGNDDWPMFHHDLSLSGYSMSDGPDTNDLAWTYQTGGPVESSPAISNGVLYVGSKDGNLYALDAVSGSLLWSYSAGSIIQSSPAVAEGSVYFLATNGTIYALDAATGALNWSDIIGPGPWDWSSPAVSNGNVFIASSNGNLYSLKASDGTINWITAVGGTPDSPINVTNGKVYTGTHNFDNSSPTLVAVDEATGAILWAYDYYTDFGGVTGMVNSNGAAVVDGDADGDLDVYFGVYNWNGVGPQAICLEEATGNLQWATSIGGNSTSTPAVHNGVVFIGSDDGQVYALNASDGSIIWTTITGGQVWAAPAVADGKVYVGSWDHTLYALDEATGAILWTYFTGASRLISSPAVADGMLFVGNENGNVYAFMPDLRISKELVEYWDDDGDGNIEVGEYTEFWLSITVENKDSDDTIYDVVVKDRLGGDLQFLDYELTTGSLDTGNVKGKTEKQFLTWDGFDLGPGESATLDLLVATDINPGQGKKDSPQYEYTEAGDHYLNSGANVKGEFQGIQISATSNPIMVTVVEPTD